MLCSSKVIPYLRRAQARSYRLRIIDSSLKGYIDFGLGKKLIELGGSQSQIG